MGRNTDPTAPAVDEPTDDALDASQETDQGDETPDAVAETTKQAPEGDRDLLQRAYTQSQQRWHDLRKALELPKDASPDDVYAAIQAERQAAAASRGEDGDTPVADAATLQLEARAEAAEWRYQNALFPGTAEAAKEFSDLARQERDPEQLTTAFYDILNRFAASDGAAATPAQEGEASDDSGAAGNTGGDERVDTGFGDSPAADVSTDAAALARLRGSGNIREGMKLIPGLPQILGIGGQRKG